MLSGRQKKTKRAKIKKERVEKPQSVAPAAPLVVAEDDTEKDLTYYIRDRVELMRQIFSILKDRELVAMAPQCLRTVKVDDLQELCLDEVLGISSTRLASILDGCSCPSDTDSSEGSLDSAPRDLALETISLDSISSDEGQPPLAQASTKPKKKKHHRRHQQAEPGAPGPAGPRCAKGERGGGGGKEKEERGPAGMTVLELLELQARARAIRAQLQAVHANIGSDPEEEQGVSAVGKREGGSADEEEDEDEVVIKEEPPEVVEVVSSSSDQEYPSDIKKSGNAKKSSTSLASSKDKSKNDHVKAAPTLVVSMPVIATQNPPRKIKLKRNNLLVSVANVATGSGKATQEEVNVAAKSPVIDLDKAEDVEAIKDTPKDADKDNATKQGNGKRKMDNLEFVDGAKSSKPKGEKDNTVPFDGRIDGKSVKDRLGKMKRPKNKGTGKASKKKSKTSIDEDEIMLELSDTEKNDLLDSFDSKSSSSEESSDEEPEVDPGKDTVDKLTTKDDKVMKTDRNDEMVKTGEYGELMTVTGEAKNPDDEVEGPNVDKAIVESQNEGVVHSSSVSEVIDLDSGGEVDKNAAEKKEIKDVSTSDVVDDSKGVEVTVAEDVEARKSPDKAELDQSLAVEAEVSPCEKIAEPENAKDKNPSSKKKKKKSKKSSRESRRSSEGGVSEKTKKNLEDRESVGKKKRQNSAKDLENLQPNTAAKEVLIGDSLNIRIGLESIENNDSVVSLEIPEEELSEGECSYSSDGIEITEMKHEVVCISDDAVSVDSVEEGRPKKKKFRKRRKSQSSQDSNSSEDCGKRKDPSFEMSEIENVDNANNTEEELGKYDDDKEVESVSEAQDETCKEKIDEVSLEVSKKDSGNGKVDSSQTKNTEDLATKDPGLNTTAVIEMKTEKMDLDKDRINSDSVTDAMKEDDYEVFEISDDSSDEEVTSMSKEPTTEEIVELSKKIDSEIDREDIVFERRVTGEMVDVEMRQEILKSVGVSAEELTDSSWKERWLKSDKVKKVLATSNLCNALRKKNKEIKLKLIEEAKAEQALIKKQKQEEEIKLKQINKLKTRVDNLNVEDNANERLFDVPEIGVKTGTTDKIDTESDVKIDEGCTEGVKSGVETKESCNKGIKSGVETQESCNEGIKSGVETKESRFEGAEIDIQSKEGAVEGGIDIEPSKLMPIEGSVDLYMTLASCTKYVDPVIDHIEENRKKAMAKDARQLMKMYKKLVKIHSKVAGEKKKKKKKDKKDRKEKKDEKEKKISNNDLSNITETSQL